MKSSLVKILLVIFLAVGIVSAGAAVNAVDVGPRHGNLRAAQRFVERAINKISDAQVANEYDMEGHAARAKELLARAYDEIKMAAMASNR
jgi:hypothetical protein